MQARRRASVTPPTEFITKWGKPKCVEISLPKKNYARHSVFYSPAKVSIGIFLVFSLWLTGKIAPSLIIPVNVNR